MAEHGVMGQSLKGGCDGLGGPNRNGDAIDSIRDGGSGIRCGDHGQSVSQRFVADIGGPFGERRMKEYVGVLVL